MPIFDPEIFLPDLFTGPRRNLFRGQCIGAKVDVIGSDCIVTLDLEDYNRLPPLIAVGAPSGTVLMTQDDGTVIFIDAKAQINGIASAMQEYPLGYWPANGLPDLDLVTGFLSDDAPGTMFIDFGTALSNLKSFVDAQVPFISGGVRWWLQPPPIGNGLILYVVDFNETDQTDLLPAPYEIDNDNPNWTTRVMPEKLSVQWDWASNRDSGYIRGGTPPGEGSGWGWGIGGGRMGDLYIDSPGSITLADRTAIAAWHEAQKFIAQLSASATMLPGWQDPADPENLVTSQPWHVGQTVLVTSVAHSRLDGMVAGDRELDARPCVIQSVTGRLVTPSNSISIKIDGVLLEKPFEWKSLNWEELLGGAGKATAVIHLLGDADTLTIGIDADVWITDDDENPADIEWDLTVGTMPRGALTRELAKPEVKPPVQPVYRFHVTVRDPDMLDGGTSEVAAQLADGPEAAIALGGVPMEWVLIQWEDDAETVPGTVYELADDTGTTDTAGRVFTTMTRTGAVTDEYHYEVNALALEQ